MESGVKNPRAFTDKQTALVGESKSSNMETQEEMDQRLLGLLGEVIRMSQAWVRALESGDPFTADECEAECVLAMERFEANRKRSTWSSDSLEQTK